MSPVDRNPAARWLDFARDDLAYAMLPLPEGASCNIACFHAQYEEISAAQYQDALRIASEIVVWAEGIVGHLPGMPRAA
jgi:hypothetical protein